MKKFEVIDNGNPTGVYVEAENQIRARVAARKMGYRIFTVVDVEQTEWEARMGRPEYIKVMEYFQTLEGLARDIREADQDAARDVMATLAEGSAEETYKLPRPTAGEVAKATEWARTTGKVAFDGFVAKLRKHGF